MAKLSLRLLLFGLAVILLGRAAVAQERFAAAAKAAEQARQELEAPGLSVAAVIDDELVWSAGFGLADIENAVPARGNTVYRIASISKTFGATAVLQLVERGRVKVDDPITTYVPTFAHPVTLRQILTHTSGIRHYKPGENNSMTRYDSLAGAIAIFKNDPLTFPAGTRTLYSSYAFNLIQGVVETASGQSLEQYLNESILKPAGMKETYLEYAERIVPNRARGYEGRGSNLRNATYADLSVKWLGGGMISSAEDLVRYHIALNKGTLAGPESLKLMNTAGKLNDGTPIEYSLGWETSADWRGYRSVDKYGSGAGVSTYLLRVPDRKFAIAVLVNVGGRGNIQKFARRIAEAVLDARPSQQ